MKRDHAQDHPQKQRTVIKRLALVISYFFKNNSTVAPSNYDCAKEIFDLYEKRFEVI